MPWSPTQQFPHPLANIQSSNADPSISNYISYTLVEMLTWQGLGDLINKFRQDSLGLDPISMIWAPGMLHRLKIPYTYCWYVQHSTLHETESLMFNQVTCIDSQTKGLGTAHIHCWVLLLVSCLKL